MLVMSLKIDIFIKNIIYIYIYMNFLIIIIILILTYLKNFILNFKS